MPAHMSPAQAAEVVGVSRWSIMRAINARKLQAVRGNRNQWLIASDDLAAWAEVRSAQCAPAGDGAQVAQVGDLAKLGADLAAVRAEAAAAVARADAAERARDVAEASVITGGGWLRRWRRIGRSPGGACAGRGSFRNRPEKENPATM